MFSRRGFVARAVAAVAAVVAWPFRSNAVPLEPTFRVTGPALTPCGQAVAKSSTLAAVREHGRACDKSTRALEKAQAYSRRKQR